MSSAEFANRFDITAKYSVALEKKLGNAVEVARNNRPDLRRP